MPLHVQTGTKKLIVAAGEGKLFAGNTCCSTFAILVCNSNLVRDDNFKVILNGVEIGTIDNNSNTCTGRIFSSDIAVTAANHFGAIALCAVSNLEPTLLLNIGLLVVGANTLRIESIQDNGNGNAGSVLVSTLCSNGVTYSENAIYLNTIYAFASGVGLGQDFVFTYP